MKYLLMAMMVGCHIPDGGDIAACLRECNAESQTCFDTADTEYLRTLDKAVLIRASQACGHALVECIAQCAEDA